MKYQGRLVNWNDERGFGFIEPVGGGARAFVHIKAFSGRSRRPQNGDLISYQAEKDNKGKLRASQVRLLRDSGKPTVKGSSRPQTKHFVLVPLFFSVLTLLFVTGMLPIEVLLYYLLISLVTYIVYAVDKSAAQHNRWRTPETHLHLIALLGGWPGASLAQQRLRHKSVKTDFKAVFWFTVTLNLSILGYLLTPGGQALLVNLTGS